MFNGKLLALLVTAAALSVGPALTPAVASIALEAVSFQETSVALDGWSAQSDADGTFRASEVTGNKSQFTFSGTTVAWITRIGPAQGQASVTIDNVSRGIFDLYAVTPESNTLSFSGLSASGHNLVVKVLATKNAASTGHSVAVDGFTVGATTTQEDAPPVVFDRWKGLSKSTASGGSYRTSVFAGSTATFSFVGTGVDWITYTGPNWGKAEVYLDGVDQGTVDLYAPTLHAQTIEAYGGLVTGPHTITVQVLGTKNPAAIRSNVSVDAFVVH